MANFKTTLTQVSILEFMSISLSASEESYADFTRVETLKSKIDYAADKRRLHRHLHEVWPKAQE